MVRRTTLMLSRVAAPPSSRATRRVARNERRKPRANKRRYVGSCMELGRLLLRGARSLGGRTGRDSLLEGLTVVREDVSEAARNVPRDVAGWIDFGVESLSLDCFQPVDVKGERPEAIRCDLKSDRV